MRTHIEKTQVAITAISRYLESKDKKFLEFVEKEVDKLLVDESEPHIRGKIKAWILKLLVKPDEH